MASGGPARRGLLLFYGAGELCDFGKVTPILWPLVSLPVAQGTVLYFQDPSVPVVDLPLSPPSKFTGWYILPSERCKVLADAFFLGP